MIFLLVLEREPTWGFVQAADVHGVVSIRHAPPTRCDSRAIAGSGALARECIATLSGSSWASAGMAGLR